MTQFIDKNKNVWVWGGGKERKKKERGKKKKEHKGTIQIGQPYHTPGLEDMGSV